MEIAVVDDNKDDIKWLKNLFDKYCESFSNPINIDYFSAGEQLLQQLSIKKYQLVIMDIFMEKMDGIETATCLQEKDNEILVAFLSSSEDEVWRAVKTHGCFDYIQKNSFDIQRLEQLLDDVYKMQHVQERCLVFFSGKQEIKLILKNVLYIVSNDKYTMIKQNEHVRQYRITFSMIYKLLENEPKFILCNRGIMLNMDFILGTDGDIFQVKDGTNYPIRRKGRKQIIERFHDYQFQILENQRIY